MQALPLGFDSPRLHPPFTRVSFVSQRLFAAQHKGRPMRRYCRDRKSERLAAPAQLELPLGCSPSASGDQPQNHGQSKRRRSRLSPARVAKFQEMRERRGIVPASSPTNSDANILRQGHHFVLTPALLSLINEVNAKRWASNRVAALPSLETCKEPEPSSGCAHVRRGSPRRLQTNPLGLYRRRAGLPALRLPWRLQLQEPSGFQVQGL